MGYLTSLFTLARHSGRDLRDCEIDDWIDPLDKREDRRGWTKGTKKNHQKAVRRFIKKHEGEEPEKAIKLATEKKHTVKKGSVMTPEEVRHLIEDAARFERDRAIMYLLYETGSAPERRCRFESAISDSARGPTTRR